jgi:hypothetical protein
MYFPDNYPFCNRTEKNTGDWTVLANRPLIYSLDFTRSG